MAAVKFFMLSLVVGLSLGAEHLKDLSKRMYIGSALSQGHMDNSEYNRISAEEFNMATAEWEMKWSHVEPELGKYTYELGDRILAFTEKNKMRMRGHNLIWHEEVPDWAYTLDKEALRKAIINRIIDQVTHYKGKFYAWDVVNEAFEWNGALNHSIFYNNFGEIYISDAFKLAKKYDPQAKMYINDYNIEAMNDKSYGLYELVKKLKAQGVPIDGVGFQGHFSVGNVPTDFQQNLERFIALGVEVAITELDISIPGAADKSTLEQQAKDYASVFATCQKLEKCVGVTVWDWCDRFSYNASSRADLWDVNMKPKPAVEAIIAVLKGK